VFRKILIANRGEIACRVIGTCRRLGIATVAVYSDADAGALHVDMADEAVRIGPAPAAESYLNADAVIEAAVATGAEAVHPGYGFLSENADFADAVEEAGLVYIGPPAEAIRDMGDKSAAKAIMDEAGVPLVPGYHGDAQDIDTLRTEAAAVGYPVLLKAAAGGGGKGMRPVRAEAELADAIDAAKRESNAAFGDDRLLIEKLIENPRHVEIQIFADQFGNTVHLYERDCSIQRRHQKVIEEAGLALLPTDVRLAMTDAAIAAAEAIGYVGAGTVEFLLDAEHNFYFMEMNTRLQVEHPVTEMVLGEDLVEWQIMVAAGHDLPRFQEEMEPSGHAIEARLYAEDPDKGFLPQTGTLIRFHVPDPADFQGGFRIDTGVAEGGVVDVHYDPMIAKVVVWGRTREDAVHLLGAVLERMAVAGVVTNLDFLARLARHEAFADFDVDTGFLDRHGDALLGSTGPVPDSVLAAAVLAVLLGRDVPVGSADPHSPWARADGWRLNGDNHHDLVFLDGGSEVPLTAHFRRDGYALDLPGGRFPVSGRLDADGTLAVELDGVRFKATVTVLDAAIQVNLHGRSWRLGVKSAETDGEGAEVDGRLAAPMPGRIAAVLVAEGDVVARGDVLMVLEAMKMEHAILAPADGTVAAVHFVEGEQAAEGVELLSLELA
jgi:3-methylcrotonyl-CoA carboxylase alpha subunit